MTSRMQLFTILPILNFSVSCGKINEYLRKLFIISHHITLQVYRFVSKGGLHSFLKACKRIFWPVQRLQCSIFLEFSGKLCFLVSIKQILDFCICGNSSLEKAKYHTFTIPLGRIKNFIPWCSEID